jgi:hypothetical protein
MANLAPATWALANDQPAAIGHLNRVRALDPELPDGAKADRLRANARAFLISACTLSKSPWRCPAIVAQVSTSGDRAGSNSTNPNGRV